MNSNLSQLFNVLAKHFNPQNQKSSEIALWFEEQCKKINPSIDDETIFDLANSALADIFYLDNSKNKNYTNIKKDLLIYVKNDLIGIEPNHKSKVIEALKSIFPNWTIEQYEDVYNYCCYKFNKLLKSDSNAILERINESYLVINKINYQIDDMVSYFKKVLYSKYSLVDRRHQEYELITTQMLEQLMSKYNANESNKDEYILKIAAFSSKTLKSNQLTESQKKLFELFVDLSMDEKIKTYKDYVKAVKSKLDYTEDNFKQLMKRLKDKIKSLNTNLNLKDELLSFGITDNSMEDDLKTLELIDFIVTKSNFSPYRFSAEELVKMLNLKSLFQKYGFEFDRFPEVYYDDYENYKNIYGEIVSEYEDTPDYLGVYKFNLFNNLDSTEGIIVLFKDRIEKYASKLSNKNGLTVKKNIKIIRLLVLVHELGHWMCHWPKVEGENWSKGYSGSYKKTHESLAQLITYWLINQDEKTLQFFENHLVPRDNENPYALYKKLVVHPENKIIENIKFLREKYFLTDDISYHILLSYHLISSVEFWIEYFYSLKATKDYEKNYLENISEDLRNYLFDTINSFKAKDFNAEIRDALAETLLKLNPNLSFNEGLYGELKSRIAAAKYGI